MHWRSDYPSTVSARKVGTPSARDFTLMNGSPRRSDAEMVPDLLGSNRMRNTDVAVPGARARQQLKATQDPTSSR